MSFDAPTAEQSFVLEQAAGVSQLGVDGATLQAVLEGVGQFAKGEWAPLNRIGDTEGARLTKDGVRLPAGFKEAYAAFVESGWGSLAAPEAFGGQGLPFAVQAAVMETLGAANIAFTLCPILTVGAIEALLHHGTPEQQGRYLPHLATGAWSGTMNLTEPQAGSDVGALRTRAEPRGDGTWSITGGKIFISWGDHDLAENIVHLVLARTPGAPEGTRGISLFLAPKYRLDGEGRPGAPNDIRVVSIEHKMGLHASPTCVLSFGDAGDCVAEMIGPEGGGMRAMFTMMNNARLNVGLQGVQAAEAATQKALAYALDRVQSARAGAASRASVRIVEHPDVRRMLMRMKAQTQAARALVYYAAGQVDRAARGDAAAKVRLELLTPLAKAHATDLGSEVASLGVQVHGGVGYVEETGAAQILRDVRITAIYEGTNGIQAADLVMRKLPLENGAAFAGLIADIRADARAPGLKALVDACERIGGELALRGPDDRLAGSYPFLTMLSVAVCGWLLERQAAAVADDAFGRAKRTVAGFYLDQVLPEALGLAASAEASAAALYALDAEALAR
jgi:alkylation response protein AidB-like acyl-CoA dehydrogenase